MVQAMSLGILYAICTGLLLYLDMHIFINQVFNNVRKILNSKQVKKTLPSDCFLLVILEFVRFSNQIIQLETVKERLILLVVLVGSICISLFLLYERIHRKVTKELEYYYDNKTSFSIFMTLFFSVLLYKWSGKIPSREELEADKKFKDWTDKVSGDWVDDYDPFRGEWIDDTSETNFKKPAFKKPTKELIDDIINLKYGCFPERKHALESMGYDYDEVQHVVNIEILRRHTKEEDIKRIYKSLLKDKISDRSRFRERSSDTTINEIELMETAKKIYDQFEKGKRGK